MLSEIFLEQPSPLYIHAFTNNWSLSYPVCVQLCLHCRDVAPYRLLLLQLLTFNPQPVQELLQRHVEPFPRGHLWVQVGPSNTNTFALSKLSHAVSFGRTPSRPSPPAEGLVAQVIPALAHVVQTSPEQSCILRVPQRGHDPLAVLIQGVIQLCVAVDLCLKVLGRNTQ